MTDRQINGQTDPRGKTIFPILKGGGGGGGDININEDTLKVLQSRSFISADCYKAVLRHSTSSYIGCYKCNVWACHFSLDIDPLHVSRMQNLVVLSVKVRLAQLFETLSIVFFFLYSLFPRHILSFVIVFVFCCFCLFVFFFFFFVCVCVCFCFFVFFCFFCCFFLCVCVFFFCVFFVVVVVVVVLVILFIYLYGFTCILSELCDCDIFWVTNIFTRLYLHYVYPPKETYCFCADPGGVGVSVAVGVTLSYLQSILLTSLTKFSRICNRDITNDFLEFDHDDLISRSLKIW